jgi:NTP pyrophosphatase (non-canonical NTP hydrolase)
VTTQEEIGQWHREKFGATTDELNNAIAKKVREESYEFIEAHFLRLSSVEEEAADTAIALMAYCDRRGIDLHEAIKKKMRVNWCREWKQNDKGEWIREKA